MPGRKSQDREDAQHCLHLIAASDLIRAAWCADHPVDGRSLGAWAQNLQRRSQEEAQPGAPPSNLSS
jgi:hypothetical protein